MQKLIQDKKLYVLDMTCVGCQNKIKKKLSSLNGVISVTVSYNLGTVDIHFNTKKTSIDEIVKEIETLGYKVKDKRKKNVIVETVSMTAVIIAIYVLLERFGILNSLVPSQLAESKMGYEMLFVVGMITSVHCIAMCGGINLSQCIPRSTADNIGKGKLSTFAPSIMYNLGRVISYTAIGFILGFVGWSFGGGGSIGISTHIQGILKLIAGVFMVIMGLNMLNLFPAMRKLNPRMPRIFTSKEEGDKGRNKTPFVVGLLNGFMPCGPLQSMQIIALATANPFVGALSMLTFSLGTVPLMLGLGSLVLSLGKRFTKSVMTVGAVLVVVLGLAMLSQAGSLSGLFSEKLLLLAIIFLAILGVISNISFTSHNKKMMVIVTTIIAGILIISRIGAPNINEISSSEVKIVDETQVIESTLSTRGYPDISVKSGIPVKWTITASDENINGCNDTMFINEYGIEHAFTPGDNLIEFTPTRAGTFQYSCWMGMIRATITVID